MDGDTLSMVAARLTLWHTVIGGTIAFGTYAVLLVLYRLTLHPLAKYPGPLLAKVSGWSNFLESATGDRHLIHLKQHENYGPVVRISPNTLSFSSGTAARQIYQISKDNNPFRKSEYYEAIDAPSGAYSIHTEVSRKKHAARRRVLDHAFSGTAIRSNEPYVIETVETLCQVLNPPADGQWSEARNMSKYTSWFAYDVMGALVFGRQFGCLTDAAHRYVPELIISSSFFVYPAGLFPLQTIAQFFLGSSFLMKFLGGQMARDADRLLEYAELCLAERKEQQKIDNEKDSDSDSVEKRDMMHYILNARDPVTGAGYTSNEILADAGLLIFAGSDTTSVVLAALFFYLTLPQSQSFLTRLQDEVRSRFDSVDEINGLTTAPLLYLRACIDEAMRLAPPAPGHLPRTVAQKGGITIDGYHVPEGITVGVAAYVVHRDEDAFPDPWTFQPDRWLAPDPATPQTAEQFKQARLSFLPFSIGSRGCIGKELAYKELTICMARLIYLFDFRRAEKAAAELRRKGEVGNLRHGVPIRENEFQMIDCFLVDRDGPEIEFRRWVR